MKQVGDKMGIRGLLLLMLTFVFCGKAMAEDFTEGGLYYSTLSESTVKVVAPTEGKYVGDITIPEYVIYNDTKYRVRAIGDNAFQGSTVTSVTLPLWGITSIGSFAFNDCTGLTEFTIPSSVKSIGQRAFYYCDKLQKLYVHRTNPYLFTIASEAFSGINRAGNVCTLYVPTGHKDSFVESGKFSDFTQVEEFDPPIYNLWVGGTRVTTLNAADILGDGVASYDASTNTLTIGGDITVTGSESYEKSGIYSFINDLTIQISKPSTISADDEVIYATSATITGSSLLTVMCTNADKYAISLYSGIIIKDAHLNLTNPLGSHNGGTLTVQSSTIDISTTSAKGALNSLSNMTLTDCFIATPEDGMYDTTDKRVEDKNGDVAKTVSIKPGQYYDLYVAGTHVNSYNAADILGDGAASYNASTNTLTISKDISALGAGYEAFGVVSSIADLTVQVDAPTTITSVDEGLFFMQNATITGASLLTIKSTNDVAIIADNNVNITIKDANLNLSGLLRNYSYGTLTIESSKIDVSTNSAKGAICDWNNLVLTGCYIETPEGGVYNTSEKQVKDKNGNVAQKVSIKLNPEPNELAFSVPQAAAKIGEEFVPPVLSNPNKLPVTWTSSQETVATINPSTGEITLVASGQTIITATFAGNEEYLAGSASYELIVVEADIIVVTAKSYEIEYGDKIPAFEYTCDGTISGAPSITCDASKSSPVGTYTIVVTKGSVTNTNVTYVNGTLTITKAPLKITAKDYTIKKGDVLPTFEATYEGFKNDDTEAVLTKQPVFTTTATSASEPGEYDINVSDAEALNYEITYVKGKLTIENPDFIPGDVNGDGLVNVTDIVVTVNFIMEKPSDNFNKAAADLNGDGLVNVTDIVKMVTIIMNGNN